MDNQVKQRVIGAVVLVALAVIFVPMLLEKPDSDLGPVGSNLPEQPEHSVQDRIEPLTLPEPPAEEEPVQIVIDQVPPAGGTVDASDGAMPADPGAAPGMPGSATSSPADAAPAAVPAAVPAPAPTPAIGGSTTAPAPAATPPSSATPAAAAAAQPVGSPAPIASQPAADKAATAPAAQPAPAAPVKPAPVLATATAPKPLSGWVVQLASLAKKDNALALRERLRGLGYTAFVEELKTPQGVLYRVRVGPELERANADNLRARLEQQVQIKGIVARYP